MQCTCGHDVDEHGQERALFLGVESKIELCLRCPGYTEPGYPKGTAYHRFKEANGEFLVDGYPVNELGGE